ncbi:MAG: hypothetical protein BHV28_12870 [Candidatus Tokpelaia hoelldobleri]|uniref:Uncharacterized protein n=1 Tax=Candidatus Tokpelaia hoelldobleri TaxID=1902579 RepID=A0A1U9JVV6_9HYPH|nr:MAG: hypothetical protein BHV28_12870 [Candidatus Tokpelaia hoelldoblerii]
MAFQMLCAVRHTRVVETALLVFHHAKAVHNSDGARVVPHGETDDFSKLQRVKAICQQGAGGFCRIAPAPIFRQ